MENMNNINDEEEQPVPGKKSPFRVIRKKDGKTYVEPDARLIKTEQVQEQGGWLYDFRKFIERWHIHYYIFSIIVVILAYEAASHYFPLYTGLITGLVIASLIVSNMGAYSTAVAEDRHHREWVHVASFEAEEVDLGPDLDDINVSRKTLQIKMTSVQLFEIRDYMRMDESKFRLHFENDQVFEGLTKIHEDTSVDNTTRIFTGERDGIPAGVVFKLGMPSVDYVGKQIEKVKKELNANGNKYDDIAKFAKMHKAWTKQWDYMQKFLRKKGVTAFSMDDVPKWAHDYFFALEKESLPFWNMDEKTREAGLGYWHALSPEFRMPMLLRIQRDYNTIRGEKVQLVTTRQSDKLEAEAFSANDILTMMGFTQAELQKVMVQMEMALTPIEDKAIKDEKEAIGVGRGE